MTPQRTHFFLVGLLLACLCSVASTRPGASNPLLGTAHADDADDNGDDTGGATLSPDLQWRLADTAWSKREFDDAAVLSVAYAEANPDGVNALEALYRAYSIYRNNRPNPDKKKEMYDKLSSAASKWLTKYASSDKERASNALWYTAMLYRGEDQKDQEVATFDQLTKRFPGTSREPDGWWYPAEIEFDAKRWSDAIAHYEGYRKSVGITENGAVSVFREASCYEQLGDKANAIETYKIVFDPKYNWGWWQLGWGALDAARRLLTDGAPDVSRKMAMVIVDKAPKDWTDLQNQAHALLGDAPPKKVWIYPFVYNRYETSNPSIDGRSKLTLTQEAKVLVRISYVSTTNPFSGTISITPKVEMKTIADGLKKGDGDKPTYSVDVASPDAKGNALGDLAYDWYETDRQAEAPDDLVVTRTWDKAGPDWGNCTIRVQSSQRWNFWIYLPNAKTNSNNVNIQPNEVNDGGKTFRYYNWYDLSQGMTIKFPIEVGTQVSTYYPKIYLQFDTGRGSDNSGSSTEAKESEPEYDIDVKSDKEFPFTFQHPAYEMVTLDEISK